MQRAKLDLKNFVPPWERKFADEVRETEFDRLLQSDDNIIQSTGSQNIVGNTRPLAQDVFSSLIVRQRRF